MKKVLEVLRLHLGMQLSSRKIQGATSVARTTVQEYIKRCDEAEITLNELDAMKDDVLQFKLLGPLNRSTVRSTKVMPDYDYVHNELKQAKKQK